MSSSVHDIASQPFSFGLVPTGGGSARRRRCRWHCGSLGVDANLVRLAFVVLGFANGLGLFLYAIAWVLLPVTDGQGPIVAGQSRQLDRDVDLVRGLAVGAIVLGSALLARQVSPWLPDRLLWPAVVTAAGLAMVWRRDPDRRAGDFIGTLTNGSVRTPKDVAAFITDSWSGSGRRTVARDRKSVV